MTVFQPNLVVEKHYVVPDQDDEQKRRFKMWVTDAIYMKNCQKIAIGSTSRDIRFYDVSSSHYFEEYHLFGKKKIRRIVNLDDRSLQLTKRDGRSLQLKKLDSRSLQLKNWMVEACS